MISALQAARERLDAQIYRWAGVPFPPVKDGPQLDAAWLRRLEDEMILAARCAERPF